MKTHLFALLMSALLPVVCAAADTNGFLVIKIERFAYSITNGKATEPEIKQSFKIPLTPEFLSNFKSLPNDHSEGSGFCCISDFKKPQGNASHFMWWLERASNQRWRVHMWSSSRNPSVTQEVTFKSLEDLDMFDQDSFVAPSGVNVSFSAKYMSAEEMENAGTIRPSP